MRSRLHSDISETLNVNPIGTGSTHPRTKQTNHPTIRPNRKRGESIAASLRIECTHPSRGITGFACFLVTTATAYDVLSIIAKNGWMTLYLLARTSYDFLPNEENNTGFSGSFSIRFSCSLFAFLARLYATLFSTLMGRCMTSSHDARQSFITRHSFRL